MPYPTFGSLPERVELVMCMAEGMTSQPYRTSSIIALWSDAGAPPACSCLVANCSYTADRSAPVPQAKSPTFNLPIASASDQSMAALQLIHGEARQQGSGRGQRVEGRQIFSVHDESLEHAPCEVVCNIRARRA